MSEKDKLIQKQWTYVAKLLGLRIDLGHEVQLANEEVIANPVVLKDFGARKGILLFTDVNIPFKNSEKLVGLGYGYSVIEPFEFFGESIVHEVIELLQDWGWSGSTDAKPAWI